MFRQYLISDLNALGIGSKNRNKIEDRLIQYGRNKKLKREGALYDKNKQYFDEFTYQPDISQTNNKSTLKNSTTMQDATKQTCDIKSFLDRQEDFRTKQKLKIEELKSELVNPESKELTFKPNISKFASDAYQKRNVNDLYMWKQKVDKQRDQKQAEKKRLEEEKYEMNLKTSKMNKKSVIILKNKEKRMENATTPKEEYALNAQHQYAQGGQDEEYTEVFSNDLSSIVRKESMLIEDEHQPEVGEDELDLWPVKRIQF